MLTIKLLEERLNAMKEKLSSLEDEIKKDSERIYEIRRNNSLILEYAAKSSIEALKKLVDDLAECGSEEKRES